MPTDPDFNGVTDEEDAVDDVVRAADEVDDDELGVVATSDFFFFFDLTIEAYFLAKSTSRVLAESLAKRSDMARSAIQVEATATEFSTEVFVEGSAVDIF